MSDFFYEQYLKALEILEWFEKHFVYPVTQLSPTSIILGHAGLCLLVCIVLGLLVRPSLVYLIFRREVFVSFAVPVYVLYMKAADFIQTRVENIPWLYILTLPIQFAFSMADLVMHAYLKVFGTSNGAMMVYMLVLLPLTLLITGRGIIDLMMQWVPERLKERFQILDGLDHTQRMILGTIMGGTVMFAVFRLTHFLGLHNWYLTIFPTMNIMMLTVLLGVIIGALITWVYFSGNRASYEDMDPDGLNDRMHSIHLYSSAVTLTATSVAMIVCFSYLDPHLQVYITQ